ncbi:histidine phosphatase family protein [Humidisolicoccus flavus]|uniref:histidine phosphatase family protein n=1 Tax=Humidisolicoccus flavus TaxID=3111414 RepID=UPI00324BE5C5
MSTTNSLHEQLHEAVVAAARGVDLHLHFIRHAETKFNTQHLLQGWSDSAVTELGAQQIDALSRAFHDVELDFVYSSDLPRTRTTTAGLTLPHPEVTVEFREALREWNFGAHEERPAVEIYRKLIESRGLEVDDSLSSMQQLAAGLHTDDIFDAIAEVDESGTSERAQIAMVRISSILQEILRESKSLEARNGRTPRIAVVSHGGVIPTMVRQLVPSASPEALLPNCSVTTVQISDGTITLEGMGVPPESFSL